MWIRTNWLHLTYYTTAVHGTKFENDRACRADRLIFDCKRRVRFLGLFLRNSDERWIYKISPSSPTYPRQHATHTVGRSARIIRTCVHVHSRTAEVAINSGGFLYFGWLPSVGAEEEKEAAGCVPRVRPCAAFTWITAAKARAGARALGDADNSRIGKIGRYQS